MFVKVDSYYLGMEHRKVDSIKPGKWLMLKLCCGLKTIPNKCQTICGRDVVNPQIASSRIRAISADNALARTGKCLLDYVSQQLKISPLHGF